MTGTAPGVLAAAHPVHRALVYRDVDEFVTLTARVIHGALAATQPVLAALPTLHLRLVREALQSDGADVRWVDMSAEGRNPGRILPAVLTAFEDEHAGATVTMVGEPIWPGRNANEYAAALAHEALINVAFAGHELSVVCPYDAAGLSEDAMHDAHRTHPEILDRRGTRASEDYGDPVAVAAEATARLSQPTSEAVVLQVNEVDEVSPARQVVRNEATRLGLNRDRLDRFVLSAHEAIANALQHGGGRAEVRLWRDEGELVCQVDSFGGFEDVLAGRRRPGPGATSGRGLVMVNELCDLVLLRATARGATIQMRTATAAA